MPKVLPAMAAVSRFSVGSPLRKAVLLASVSVALIAAAPTSSRADAVGAAFGAGTGLVVAGLREQSSAAWSAPCGDTLFGARQTVRTLVGSTIPFTGIADITVDDGISIERTRAVIQPSVPR